MAVLSFTLPSGLVCGFCLTHLVSSPSFHHAAAKKKTQCLLFSPIDLLLQFSLCLGNRRREVGHSIPLSSLLLFITSYLGLASQIVRMNKVLLHHYVSLP
ncbi:unnamed protein product [Sphenostylis stenocarpa]|uniref:Secreted protein n=1 Tax=Sphenostylis stenocarpa TaxID=92480 RepID=A0AA86VYA8_9FABA|nr:unnamed protein product [Sphenostylis stenocarpa]